MNAFGWSEETAREYIRPIKGRCEQGEAITAFRDLYDETGELPSSQDVINRVGAKTERGQLQGGTVYLRAADGFCYVGSEVTHMLRPEKINGKPTKRMIRCPLACGCRTCLPAEWCAVQGCPTKPRGELKYCYWHKDSQPVQETPQEPSRWVKRASELTAHGGSPAGFRALLDEMAHSGDVRVGALAETLEEALGAKKTS